MNKVNLVSRYLTLIPIVLIILSAFYPPLNFPEGLGDKQPAFGKTFGGSRGCLLREDMTYWIETTQMAVRPEGFTGTYDDLLDSGIEFEKLDGLRKDEDREIISRTSTVGKTATINMGRLLAEFFFLTGLLMMFVFGSFISLPNCCTGK